MSTHDEYPASTLPDATGPDAAAEVHHVGREDSPWFYLPTRFEPGGSGPSSPPGGVADRKATLSADRRAGVGRRLREVSACLHRAGGALLLTGPATIHEQWAQQSADIEGRARDLFDQCHVPGQKRYDQVQATPGTGPERRRYNWRRPAGNRKASLTRAEWVVIGDDVKRCEALLSEIAFILQPACNLKSWRKWRAIASPIAGMKLMLDSTAFAQHPDWDEARMVFYGKPSRENPRLRGSVDEADLVAAEDATPEGGRKATAVRLARRYSRG